MFTAENARKKSIKIILLTSLIFVIGLFLLFQYSEKIMAAIVFKDDTQAEFSLGTDSDTQWDAVNSWLELDATGLTNGSGNFTSSIKDAGSSTIWNTISWTPERPTGKELPNSGQSETAYSSGNANMTNNVLLMHMNDNAASTAVADSSGSGYNGTFNDATGDPNTSAHSTTTAKFNTALEFDGVDDYIDLGDVLDMGTGDFSVSAWIKAPDTGVGKRIVSKRLTSGVGYTVWVYSSGIIVGNINDGGNAGSYGSITVDDDQWHHIAVVFDRDAVGEIYIDGVYDTGSDPISDAQGSLSNAENFNLGSSGSGNFFDGLMDEVAIYQRALSATEVTDIYKRGTLKLKHQVRSCDDAACSGETFIGPDGTGSDYYEWGTTNAITTPSFTLTNVSDNRYFQYKTYFETSDSNYSPEMKSLTVSDISSGTYYMRANGTASDKSDATSCSNASTSMSVSTHNSETFSAGDIIVLCDDGGSYTSQITIPSSGTGSTDLITYQAETGGSPVIDLNNLADYCFRGTDKEFISISGITCKNTNQSGVRITSTSLKTGFTISNSIFENNWNAAIWFDTSSVADIDISNVTIKNWLRANPEHDTNSDMAGVIGQGDISAVFITNANNVLIENSKIYNTSCVNHPSGYDCGNGIEIYDSNNVIIEGNEIQLNPSSGSLVGAHSIFFNCTDTVNGCDGSGNITRNNYIHDSGDDCYWVNYYTGNPQYYGNLCINTGDDCTDIRGTIDGAVTGTSIVSNNTCINFSSYGIQSGWKTAVTYKNNIYIANVDACDTGDSTYDFPCFAEFSDQTDAGYDALATNTLDNNIFYNSGTGGDVEAFQADDLDSGTTIYVNPGNGQSDGDSVRGTFVQWQSDNSAPDSNSIITNPLLVNISPTSAAEAALQSISPAIDSGEDMNFTRDYASSTIPYDMPSITNTGSVGSYTYDYVDIGAYEYVTPPDTTLQCTTHPSESTWYTDVSTVSISFASPYDTLTKATTTDFRYLVNQTQSPASTTIQTATLLDDAITFDPASSITSDGTWYIHALGQNEDNTSTYSANYDTYTVKYDGTNPTVANATPTTDSSTESTAPTFTWTGSDTSSGINYYQLYIDDSLDTDSISTTQTTPASALSCGDHTWFVKAIDNAGNSTSSSTFNLTVICDEDNDDNDSLEISKVKHSSTSNSITIKWETNNKADETVRYGTDKNLKKAKEDDDKSKDHKVTLKNLESDTTYYFRIKSKDSNGNIDRSRIYEVKTDAKEEANVNNVLPDSFNSSSSDNQEADENEGEKETIIDKINEIPELVQEKLEDAKFFNSEIFERNQRKYIKEVRFQINDENNNPIPNLPITLYSEPKTTITDEKGYATFNDIETGSHTLKFSYSGKNRKYSVDIPDPQATEGRVKMETVVIQVNEEGNDNAILIYALIAIIIIMGAVAIRKRRNKIE